MTENNSEIVDLGKQEEKRYFRVSAVGLDTTALNYPAELEPDEYENIHINFSSNNDEFTKPLVNKSRYVFMTVNFIDGLYDSLVNYSRNNNLPTLKCLLIDSNCDFEKYKDEIEKITKSVYVTESGIGISQPETVEQLIKINKIINFDYISLNICPLCFNADVIKWANENNKKIIGFNPFGGYMSSANLINSFTVPYLLGVIATYADYVFLSSRDLVYASNDSFYLKSLMGCTSEKLYLFTKSLNKLTPPIKKAIKNYLIVDVDVVIEVEDPCFGFNKEELVISTMNVDMEEIPEPKLAELDPETNKYDLDVNSVSPEKFINTLYLTEFEKRKPDGIDDESYLAWLKYEIMNKLGIYFNQKYNDLTSDCEITEHKICKNAIVINSYINYIERTGIFTVDRRAEEFNYLLYYKNGKFLFQKISSKA